MNTTAQQLQLRDIHLPESVSCWPPAPGYWIVLAIVLIIALLIYFVRRRQKQLQVYVVAGQELEKIKQTYVQSSDTLLLVKSLSIWLRRVSLTRFSRNEVAGITGTDWLVFLDQAFMDTAIDQRFSQGAGRALLNAPYQSSADINADDLLQLCQLWLNALSNQRRQGL